jgi:hypothetical protein
MKKVSCIALLTALGVVCGSTVFAGPVEISGEASVKYQRDRAQGESDNAMIWTLTIDGQTKLSEDLTLFTRLGAQKSSHYGFGDFYNIDTKKSAIALDQFGLSWKKDELAFKLGRQDAEIGATSLLYSRSGSNIGKHMFVDGLTVNGFVGDTEIAAVLAQEDNDKSAGRDNRLYALRAYYTQVENWTFGATLGRYDNKEAGEKTNHWAVDAAYAFGKNNLTAEWTKSNANSDNKAYALVWDYELDDKTSVSLTGFRVEGAASMGEQSDFDAGNKGIHYTVNYKIADDINLEAVYKDQKDITTKEKNNSTELTLAFAF